MSMINVAQSLVQERSSLGLLLDPFFLLNTSERFSSRSNILNYNKKSLFQKNYSMEETILNNWLK